MTEVNTFIITQNMVNRRYLYIAVWMTSRRSRKSGRTASRNWRTRRRITTVRRMGESHLPSSSLVMDYRTPRFNAAFTRTL